MRSFVRLAAFLFAVTFVCVCFAGCGKEEEIINIDDNPEYGATIDPMTATDTQVKSIITGIMPKAMWYQSFVTEPAFTTAQRLSTVDYTLEENAGYYPLSSKYGLTSYDNLIYGLNKYFSPEYAQGLTEALTGVDASDEKTEVVRYKMIGGELHIYPEFISSKLEHFVMTANFDDFTVTDRTEDGFKLTFYMEMNGSKGTQTVGVKKIDGVWYVDGIIQ